MNHIWRRWPSSWFDQQRPPDGESAQKLYSECDFDIALLDINLPDCNGIELLDKLKSLRSDSVTQMIAVSAHVYKAIFLQGSMDIYPNH